MIVVYLSAATIKQRELILNSQEDCFGVNSYDLRLGFNFTRFVDIDPMSDFLQEELLGSELTKSDNGLIYLSNEKTFPPVHFKKSKAGFIFLQPHESIIVQSQEIIDVRNGLVAHFSPRSNLSYLLDFHYSHLGDTGFKGKCSMRITNPLNSPIVLPVGMRFAQVMFVESEYVSVDYKKRTNSKNTNYDLDDLRVKFKLDKEFRGPEDLM